MNLRFSSRNSQSLQKLVRKLTYFTTPFRFKSLTYVTNLKSLNVVENILPQHSRKVTHFTNFPTNMLLVGIRKKNLHCTISKCPRTAFPKHWKRKYLYNPVYLWKKLNNFLKASHCLGLVKCFKIFYFNWKFWKFNYISAFWCFHKQHWNA